MMNPLPHRVAGKGGSSSNSGKGFYKFTFNSGGTATPAIGNTITGATSGATAIIMNIDHTSGTWAGGDEAGTLYISKPVGTFDGTENINIVAQNNVLTMTSVASIDSLDILTYITGMTAAKGVSTTNNICGCEKTDDPVDSGVTFSVNKSSRAVTLSSALSVTIDNATTTTGWALANSSTINVSTNTSKVAANNFIVTTPASGVAANTQYAVFTAGSDIDCSAYTKICFWARVSSNTANWVVKLLDSAGNVLWTSPTLTFAAATTVTAWVFDTGAALPNNVRKFAIYTGSSATNSTQFAITNIYATTVLPLNALIGLQGAEYYPLKFVNGTSVGIDNEVAANSTTGRGYALANVTSQALYIRNDMINTAVASTTTTAVQTTQVGGTNTSIIQYEAGVNPVTLEQDGFTMFNGANGNGYGVSIASTYSKFNKFVILRYFYNMISSTSYYILKDIILTGSSNVIIYHNHVNNLRLILAGNIYSVCSASAIVFNAGDVYQTEGTLYSYSNSGIGVTMGGNEHLYLNVVSKNNGVYGIQSTGQLIKISNLVTSDNVSGATNVLGGALYLYNCSIVESTESVLFATHKLFSQKHNGTDGLDKIVDASSTITKQTTVKPADAPIAWKMSPTSNARRSLFPVELKLGTFTVANTNTVTCKVRMCLSNAAINGRLIVKFPDLGLTSDQVSSTCTTVSADMSSSEEMTLTFTPIAAGTFELYAQAWYPDSSTTHTYSVYVAHPAADGNGNIPLVTQS